VTDERRITIRRLDPATLRLRGHFFGASYAAAGLLDAARLSLRLWRTLRKLKKPDLVLIQNPPAFPTLPVALFSLRRRGVRFVIDWHNLGYTLLRLRLGRWHPAVRLARWLERRDARRVDANLTVSRSLAGFLDSRFGVPKASVLYDRPASTFVPMDRTAREQLRQALFSRLGVHGGPVAFIVCPTSWTEDEDFDLIIDAVPRLEERIRGWEAASPQTARAGRSSNGASPACRRGAFSCARAGSSPRTTRKSSAAPTSGCASIDRRRGSTSR